MLEAIQKVKSGKDRFILNKNTNPSLNFNDFTTN